MLITCFTYIRFFNKWFHWLIQFCSKNVILFMLKQSDTALIQTLMTCFANIKRSLLLLSQLLFNLATSFFFVPHFWYCLWFSRFSFFLIFCILFVFQNVIFTPFSYIPVLMLDFLGTSFFIFNLFFCIFLITSILTLLLSGFSWYLHFSSTSYTSISHILFVLFYGLFFIVLSLWNCLLFLF